MNTAFEDAREYLEHLIQSSRAARGTRKMGEALDLPEGVSFEGEIPPDLLPYLSTATLTGRTGVIRRIPLPLPLLRSDQLLEPGPILDEMLLELLSGTDQLQEVSSSGDESVLEFRLDELPEPAPLRWLMTQNESD